MPSSSPWIILALGLAWVTAIPPATAQESAASRRMGQDIRRCSFSPVEDRLIGVDTEGDLVLAHGQRAKLSNLRFPETAVHRQQAVDLLRTYKEKSVVVERLGESDRWGRLPVRINLLSGGNLSHLLVEAGLAIVDPSAGSIFCQPELLAFEETAREQRLGLWAEARYNPILAERTDLLREKVNRFVIVEGRVRSVGERKQTTYLNFGGHWAEDFTIVIPRKVWTLMAERGIDAAALKGQRIRARGILQSWQGTALTIEMPEMIERLEGNRLPR